MVGTIFHPEGFSPLRLFRVGARVSAAQAFLPVRFAVAAGLAFCASRCTPSGIPPPFSSAKKHMLILSVGAQHAAPCPVAQACPEPCMRAKGCRRPRTVLRGRTGPDPSGTTSVGKCRTWEGTAAPVPTKSGAVPKKRLRLRGFNP